MLNSHAPLQGYVTTARAMLASAPLRRRGNARSPERLQQVRGQVAQHCTSVPVYAD